MLTKVRLLNAPEARAVRTSIIEAPHSGQAKSRITVNEQKSWCHPKKKLQRLRVAVSVALATSQADTGRVGFRACPVTLKPGKATVVPRFPVATSTPKSLIPIINRRSDEPVHWCPHYKLEPADSGRGVTVQAQAARRLVALGCSTRLAAGYLIA